MSEVQVKIMRVRDNADLPLPSYQSLSASGMDLLADIQENIVLQPLERALIATGIAIEIPPGTEAQVRARSGLAVKQGVALVNAPGTIDADYRGEIKVILINLGSAPVTFSRGDRIAQLVVMPILRAKITEVTALEDSARGAGGFGSTGS